MATTGQQASPDAKFDVAIIGAGFAGLYALYKLRGLGFSVRTFEAAPDVGGTWYWNRYPGARCDIESVQYSYSFDRELELDWTWSERFATQPEILAYINHVADRFNMRQDIMLETRIDSVVYDDDADHWTLTDHDGNVVRAKFVVMATGCLSAARIPDLPGLDNYRGRILHTADWPHEDVDFSGQKVAVIGTGSSGIQAIPEVAKTAAHLHVFQRTPNFSVPARNQPLTEEKINYWKENYPLLRKQAREETPSGTIYDFPTCSALDVDDATREAELEARWQKGGANFMHAYSDFVLNEKSNEYAAEFVRNKIREIVEDPEVAEALCPTDYPIFTKRICVDTGYYDAFNQSNVTLVNLRKTPLEEITETGIHTSETQFDFDVIVFATGFDAITGALTSIDLRGVDGQLLRNKWADGPRTYLGLMTAGFPNLFTITGPQSPSVLSNMLTSIEQHVDWIGDCLEMMKEKGADRIEPAIEAENEWVEHVNAVADQTLFPRAASWYMGANIPGKARVFLPYIGVHNYRRKCDEVVADGYRGFLIDGANSQQGTRARRSA